MFVVCFVVCFYLCLFYMCISEYGRYSMQWRNSHYLGSRGTRPSSGGRGGGARGWHRMNFFPIILIVHNQKLNGGPMGGLML